VGDEETESDIEAQLNGVNYDSEYEISPHIGTIRSGPAAGLPRNRAQMPTKGNQLRTKFDRKGQKCTIADFAQFDLAFVGRVEIRTSIGLAPVCPPRGIR
jgi:hypothetical protein